MSSTNINVKLQVRILKIKRSNYNYTTVMTHITKYKY